MSRGNIARTVLTVVSLIVTASVITAQSGFAGLTNPPFPYTPTALPVDVVLESVSGEVHMYRDGIPEAVTKGDLGRNLEAFDLIFVDQGTLTFTTDGEDQVQLAAGGALVPLKESIWLFSGEFSWDRADGVEIETPFGTVNLVGQGSGRLEPARMRLAVSSGRALVADGDQTVAVVARGRSIVLPRSAATEDRAFSGEPDVLRSQRERLRDQVDQFYASYRAAITAYLTESDLGTALPRRLWSDVESFLPWYGYVRWRKLPWFQAPDMTTAHLAEALWLLKAFESDPDHNGAGATAE